MCAERAHARALCLKHYARWRTHGDPAKTLIPTRQLTAIETFQYYMPGAPPSDDSCWEWAGYVNQQGYGVIRKRQVGIAAHRLAFEHWNGSIPQGLVIRHSCDNRRCVQPKHLLLGTPADNNRDMMSRGRHNTARGVDQPGSKLTDTQVVEIRSRYESGGIKQSELSIEYGVAQSLISLIVRRKAWKHV